MDKQKTMKEKERKVKKFEKKPKKQIFEEDIEPEVTDNMGVTHIPPECIEE